MAGIDRIAPTRRPSGKPGGYQRWRELGFFHWPVPVDEVRRLVPEGLDVDAYEGTAYVGLVPFRMEGVRPAWAPEALAFDFLETNVRTYVHVAGTDPGVYFFSLDAASRIAVWVARAGWGLPYVYSTTHQRVTGDTIEYSVRREPKSPATLDVTWTVGEHLGASEPGTLEHFLFERYLLHVPWRGRLYTGQVHHAPYPVKRATVVGMTDGLVAAAGFSVTGPPQLSHYSAGVDVEIFDLKAR